jgi:hypothetical protein
MMVVLQAVGDGNELAIGVCQGTSWNNGVDLDTLHDWNSC